MKGFGIYVKNDLLDPKHANNIKNAIWLYLWLLDKMTSISEEGLGKVLGGKPVVYDDFNKEVPTSLANYRRYVKRLRDYGYINTLRTPTGLVITINKAFKPFKSIKNDTSKPRVMYQKRNSDVSKMYKGSVKSDTSNIRQYKDNTKTIGEIVESRASRATAEATRRKLESKGILNVRG
jgi:hypothetical protein